MKVLFKCGCVLHTWVDPQTKTERGSMSCCREHEVLRKTAPEGKVVTKVVYGNQKIEVLDG